MQIAHLGEYDVRTPRDAEMAARLLRFLETVPCAFERDPATGHVTGSAVVLSACRRKVLLTHHAKLDLWLQLGGHCDGVRDVRAVALREAQEESGLRDIHPLGQAIFDIDIHQIPASPREPAHLHHDVRYLFQADAGQPLVVSAESKDLAWVPLDRLHEVTDRPSVLVLRDKLEAWR